MLQLGHRFYWPETARFIQQDPIGDGINSYAYAANNPLVSIDPNGECLETVFDIAMVAWSAYDFVKDPSWTTGGALAADVVGAAIPFVPSAGGMAVRAGGKGASPASRAARGGRAASRAVKTVRHHVIPVEVLKKLPKNVRKAVQGKKGAPNRWSIPEDLHKQIHRGPGGGEYNEFFKDRLHKLTKGKEATAEQVMQVRDEAIAKFGLESCRP